MVKISDLRSLEVINVANGKRLGMIHDIELDVEKGKVTAFIMPGGMKGWMLFKHREEQAIPWEKLVNIGQDVILVELDSEENLVLENPRKNSEDFWDEENF